jgi:hypothetical protein
VAVFEINDAAKVLHFFNIKALWQRTFFERYHPLASLGCGNGIFFVPSLPAG